MSDSVRPHRQQPTRLPCPWDSPGKNTGVGCHFLLQCLKVKSLSPVPLCNTMDCSLPDSSIDGIFQARVLEWGAIAFSVRIETVPFFLFPWFTVTTSFWWGKQTSFGSPGGKGGSGYTECVHHVAVRGCGLELCGGWIVVLMSFE